MYVLNFEEHKKIDASINIMMLCLTWMIEKVASEIIFCTLALIQRSNILFFKNNAWAVSYKIFPIKHI